MYFSDLSSQIAQEELLNALSSHEDTLLNSLELDFCLILEICRGTEGELQGLYWVHPHHMTAWIVLPHLFVHFMLLDFKRKRGCVYQVTGWGGEQ